MQRVRWLILVISVVVLAACESAAPEPTATPAPVVTVTPTVAPTRTPQATATPYFGRDVQPGRSTATLRVIHAASQAPTLDIALNDLSLVGGLGFGLASGATAVIPGEYKLSASSRGTDGALAEITLILDAGVTTDVIITPTADGGIQFVALEGPERTLQTGTGLARAINAMTDVDTLTVKLNDSPTENPLGMGEATDLLIFDEGDLDVEFLANGAELLSNSLRLRELNSMLLVLAGISSRPQLIVFETPALGQYSLRVVNMSTDAREIDVFFDESVAATRLPSRGITERAVYSTASAILSVYAADADISVSLPYLTGQRITPRAGTTVTLAIYGPVADLRAMWIEEDVSPVPVGQSRYTFAHILPDVPSLQVGINSTDLEEIRPFGYGDVSTPVLFGEGPNRLFIRDGSRDGSLVEVHEAMPVSAGESVLYFVVGGAGGEELPPVTFSEPVQVDETLTANPVETPAGTFNVRYVNAIVSQPVIDVFQDGVMVATGLRYGTSTPLAKLPNNSFQLLSQFSGSTASLVDLRLSLTDEGDYTIFIYGSPENGINALAIEDGTYTAGPRFGSARLINLTQDQFAIFGLATVPVTIVETVNTPEPTLVPTATAIGGPEIDVGLPRLPIGVAVPVGGITTGKASRVVGAQPNSLVYIINSNNEIVATLPLVPFAPGTHTDIVIYQYRTATETSAIVLPLVYPSR